MILSGSFVSASAKSLTTVFSESILANSLFTASGSCSIQVSAYLNVQALNTDCDADFWIALDGTAIGPVGSYSAPQSGWLQNVAVFGVTALMAPGGHTASLYAEKVEGDGVVYVKHAGMTLVQLETQVDD